MSFLPSQLPAAMLEQIERSGVVAVLIIDDAVDAAPLAEALLVGGVDVVELTLRTPAALDAVRNIRRDVPDMLVGLGTVLTPEQVDQARDAGAAFAVSPGTSPRVVRHAASVGLPFAPGVMTPTDVETALELGCRELKFFPAAPSGGLPLIQSMRAPYAHLGVRFLPLGGVNAENMTEYLADPGIFAVGGSWLASRTLIAEQAWDTIAQNAKSARQAIDRLREGEDG